MSFSRLESLPSVAPLTQRCKEQTHYRSSKYRRLRRPFATDEVILPDLSLRSIPGHLLTQPAKDCWTRYTQHQIRCLGELCRPLRAGVFAECRTTPALQYWADVARTRLLLGRLRPCMKW